jgi:hypothetical protein
MATFGVRQSITFVGYVLFCVLHYLLRYTIDNKPILWAFYDRRTQPVYVRMSQATVQCHNEHNLHIQMVIEDELHHYLDDIHPVFSRLIPPHKADYFRAHMLGMGGICACH